MGQRLENHLARFSPRYDGLAGPASTMRVRCAGYQQICRHFTEVVHAGWTTAITAIRCCIYLVVLLLVAPSVTCAQDTRNDPVPANVEQLLDLLGKKDVQDWLRTRTSEPMTSEVKPDAVDKAEVSRAFSDRLVSIRQHLDGLWIVLPRLEPEIRAASSRLYTLAGGESLGSTLVIAVIFAALGYACRLMFLRRFPGGASPVGDASSKPQLERIQWIGQLFVRQFIGLCVFFFVCFGPVVILGNPNLDVVAAFVLTPFAGWVIVRAAADFGITVLRNQSAPAAQARRKRGEHLIWSFVIAAAWFAVGTAVIWATRMAGADPLVTELVAYAIGLGLLALGISTIWRLPSIDDTSGDQSRPASNLLRWTAGAILLFLWLVWVAGAMRLFWLLAIGLAIPPALRGARQLTIYLFRDAGDRNGDNDTLSFAVIVDLVLQAIVVGGAFWILAVAWNISLTHLATNDDAITVVARAFLGAAAILFAFTVMWRCTSIAIDLKLAQIAKNASRPEAGSEQARLRTLLSVVRNCAMVVFAALAVMMALSALGVQIGPLIASAGIVGVAVGFGAQSVVKDVISGFFYLLDDAFRVGEYIVSGNFSGTVESFSLRSVRLRHHRGAVFTVPFSALGAVQNGSRDFSVDKLLVTVTYDTDLEKARKLIKKIGEQLKEDPELGPSFIEPLKMQGVADFGTYGVQLKIKATVKPGAQPMLRKKALPLIKKAFEENGVEFAHPTVKVSDTDAAARAAAYQQVSSADATKASGPAV